MIKNTPASSVSGFSRRSFITRTAALAALAVAGPNLLLRGQDAASKRLNIACIGALGKGNGDRQAVSKQHNIVALVDVDTDRLGEATKNFVKETGGAKAPRGFTDFRKMFDEMSKDIDAVIISTPDHTHFVAAMWALKHKKHICVQKPMCNTIDEVRKLHAAAKSAGVVTQMGNQGRTMEGQRLVKEWIEQGVIGKLKEVYLWTNRPIWPQGPLTKKRVECPKNLEWDLWLSSEEKEPYFEFEAKDFAPQKKKKRDAKSVHPFNWRGWWQFGSGALGDMGCHIMDCAFNALGQRVPVKIEVENSPVTDLTAPLWSTLTYHLPATDKQPAFKVVWQDGSKDGKPNRPERDARIPESVFTKDTSGMMFIGTDAVIHADTYCARPAIFPEAKDDEVRDAMTTGKIKKTERRSKHAGNPQLEWASCIVEGGTPSSNFDYAAPLAEFVLLGNLAIRSGKTIEWDAATQKVTNIKAANQFIKRAGYRSGWL